MQYNWDMCICDAKRNINPSMNVSQLLGNEGVRKHNLNISTVHDKFNRRFCTIIYFETNKHIINKNNNFKKDSTFMRNNTTLKTGLISNCTTVKKSVKRRCLVCVSVCPINTTYPKNHYWKEAASQ